MPACGPQLRRRLPPSLLLPPLSLSSVITVVSRRDCCRSRGHSRRSCCRDCPHQGHRGSRLRNSLWSCHCHDHPCQSNCCDHHSRCCCRCCGRCRCCGHGGGRHGGGHGLQHTQLGAALGGLRWLVGHAARVCLGGVPPGVVVGFVFVIVIFITIIVFVVVVFIAVIVAIVVVVVGDARSS